MQESGVRPREGTRLQYVIAEFTDGRKHNKSAVTPSKFLHSDLFLDTKWYLEKQVQQAMKQVFDLHPAQFHELQKSIKKLIDHHKYQIQSTRASKHWSKSK
jgi:DNA polymerase elongation subunit (family B)